jgi:hypothetical protein
MAVFGGVCCDMHSGLASCSQVPFTDQIRRDAWDMDLSDITFTSTNYATANISFPEVILPDSSGEVYSAMYLVTGYRVYTECGTTAVLSCGENGSETN